jgi:predicted transcriptional regulator
MPMDFLRRVEKADLPLTVEEFADVNNVAVLRAAGLVEAEMVEAVEGDPDTCCAIVLRITPEGHAALTRGAIPDL